MKYHTDERDNVSKGKGKAPKFCRHNLAIIRALCSHPAASPEYSNSKKDSYSFPLRLLSNKL